MWACQVVYNFRTEHARATSTFLQIYGLPESYVVTLLSKEPYRWEHFKKAIRFLEAWQRSGTPIKDKNMAREAINELFSGDYEGVGLDTLVNDDTFRERFLM